MVNENNNTKISVAVDLLVFTVEQERLKVLMIERAEEPFANLLALPGVSVKSDEALDDAAARGILEETGLRDIYFEQIYSFGGVDRDPRNRVISVAYMALVPVNTLDFYAGERTIGAMLVDVEELLESDTSLAFDHRDIISVGRDRLKGKVEYTTIAFHFVEEEFTLPELQRVYEILLGKKLYKTNFRKKVMPLIEETDKYTSGDAHRPSRLYRQAKSAK